MKSKAVPITACLVIVGVWLIIGAFHTPRALRTWESDYAAASLQSALPVPGSRSAQRFVDAYDELAEANIITAPLYYLPANSAHEDWADQWR